MLEFDDIYKCVDRPLPNTSQWSQELIHEVCVLDEIILRLQAEQGEIVDMYGTMSIAYKNYTKLITAFKQKKEELKRRLTFVVTRSKEDKG